MISLLIIVCIIWCFLSRRMHLPCPAWLYWLVERDNPFSKINRASTIVENLDLQEGMTVLDVGCGPGRITIPIAIKVGPTGEVVALDIQSQMLDKVKIKAQNAKLMNIKFLEAAIGSNNLEHNKFDRVLLVTVLGEISNQKEALKEIFAALKPGGILSITEIIADPHFQRRSKVCKVALEAGFIKNKMLGNYFAFTINFQKPI